jgi:uncharacterized membrane protein YczE
MVMVTRSHWIPSVLLFWIGLGLLVNLYVAKALGLSPLSAPSVHLEQGYYLSVNESDFSTIAFIVLAVSALLFAFSVYVLDRHVEV